MELRLVILSLAVFSCAVPPALGHLLAVKAAAVTAAKGAALIGAGVLAKKALVAKGALVGGVLLAKKALIAKGALAAKHAVANLAAHGAAIVAAKHAAIKAKGAAILAAKAAAAKGALALAAKGAALGASVGGAVLGAKVGALKSLKNILLPPIPYPYAVATPVAVPSLLPIQVRMAPPTIVEAEDIGPQVLAARIAGLFGTVQTSMEKKSAAVGELIQAVQNKALVETPVLYDMPTPARFYPVPVVEKVETVFKKK